MSYKINTYEYRVDSKTTGSYSIKEGAKRLGLPGERLVDSFVINYIPGNNRKGE